MKDIQGEREREYEMVRWQSENERKTERRTRRKGIWSEEGNEESGRTKRKRSMAWRRWKKDMEWGTKGEESGPFDGAFVGSRGALRFATKIVALSARVRRSAPRRVICCEFINATIGATIERASFRTEFGLDSAHVRIQSSFWISSQCSVASLLTELRYGRFFLDMIRR